MKFLKYIVLFNKDTNKSKEWYAKVGFEYVRGFDGMHWFRVGEVEVMLHPADEKDNSGDAQYHIAVEDVHSFFNKMKQAGLQPVDDHSMEIVTEPVKRDRGTDFGLADPDGYLWVFTQG